MPSDRDKMKNELAKPVAPPALQRGKGYQLSSGAATGNAEEQERQNAETPKGEKALMPENQNAFSPKRTSRGFLIRDDLIKAMKRVALDDDKKLYTVLEEAIEQYLEWREEAGDNPTIHTRVAATKE